MLVMQFEVEHVGPTEKLIGGEEDSWSQLPKCWSCDANPRCTTTDVCMVVVVWEEDKFSGWWFLCMSERQSVGWSSLEGKNADDSVR